MWVRYVHMKTVYTINSQNVRKQTTKQNHLGLNFNSITYHLWVLDKLLNLSMPQFPHL